LASRLYMLDDLFGRPTAAQLGTPEFAQAERQAFAKLRDVRDLELVYRLAINWVARELSTRQWQPGMTWRDEMDKAWARFGYPWYTKPAAERLPATEAGK